MWKTNSGKLLFHDAESGIEVRENRHYRWLHLGGASIQSAMNLQDPPVLTLSYMPPMALVFDFLPNPSSLLMLGLGGGGFVRYLKQCFPQMQQTIVENNALVIALAQQFFDISEAQPKIAIIHADAKQYLSQCDTRHEIILLDIYGADSMPSIMLQASLYDDCYRNLEDGGIIAINLVIPSQQEFHDILGLIRQSFADQTLCIITKDQYNIIVLAFKNNFKPLINQAIKDGKFTEAKYDLKVGLCVAITN